MLKSYKVEIKPTSAQKTLIRRTIGVCRYIYNFYLSKNKEVYQENGEFMSAYDFENWLNNEFLPNNPECSWIKEVSSKSVKQSMINANTAFKNFFKGKSKFPKFKKKRDSNVKAYFPKNNKLDWIVERHKVRRLEKKLKREQRKLSRKYESFKLRNNIMKGKATRQNIQKQLLNVQKVYYKLTCIRTDYINKVVNYLVIAKPKYITIEDLNVTGMMKNRHLSKAISQQKFYEFRTKLIYKCHTYGIQARLVDRFYPSSKLCHKCGAINKDLKLSDRVYRCICGYVADRDYNASLNLRDCETYTLA